MKPIALVLVAVLGLPVPALAQGPLTAQAHAALARQTSSVDVVVVREEMEHPTLFWIGVALMAAGAVAMVAAVSFDRESDLSNEYRTIRLGRDLAPCGTDPADTLLPIAECQANGELLWMGAGLAVAGGGLMVYGGRQIQHVAPAPPTVRYSFRF